jgi:hypothetical protein
MEKYSKILIYIFLLCIVNSILVIFTLFNSYPKNKQLVKPNPISTSISTSKPSPIATMPSKDTPATDIKSDLNVIKAELRALRDAVENTGVIVQTPKP